MRKKENRLLFYISSFTWGLLTTLMGFLVLSFIKLFMKDKILRIYWVAGRICVVLNYRNLGGASMGLVYIVGSWSETKLRIHLHEMGHSIQNAYWGPFFPIFIGFPSMTRAALWKKITKKYLEKHGKKPDYYSIWFEGNANVLGEAYLKEEALLTLKDIVD